MGKRINHMVAKTPIPIILVILLLTNSINGIFISIINTKESKIINHFDINVLFIIGLCYLGTIGCSLLDKVFSKTYKMKTINKLYLKYLDKILRSKMKDIQNVSTGKVYDSIKDICVLTANIHNMILWIFPTLLPFISLMYKEWRVNHWMAIISLISVILTFILTIISDRLFNWNTDAKIKKAILQGITVDNFMNIKTLKYLHKQRYAMNRLKKAQDDAFEYTVNVPHIAYFRIVDIIGILPLIVNVYIGRNDPEMISLIMLSHYVLENMRYHTLGIAEVLIELKAQKNIIKDLKGDDTEQYPPMRRFMNLNNVTFDYGNDSVKFIIDNMEFREGSRTLVYGESGEGKSSLANLIAGGIQPSTGDVPLYKSYYIWQETESFDDTLWNNIVFDNPYNVSENEILELFKELNMIDWFCSLADGFNTQIGERGCKLSSGQKQRINIIRLIIEMRYDPNKIFIIDEITSNLDSVTRELAINLIDRECESTLICISHNEGFDKICDHKILVKDHRFINE